jgi:hypothetical protein
VWHAAALVRVELNFVRASTRGIICRRIPNMEMSGSAAYVSCCKDFRMLEECSFNPSISAGCVFAVAKRTSTACCGKTHVPVVMRPIAVANGKYWAGSHRIVESDWKVLSTERARVTALRVSS